MKCTYIVEKTSTGFSAYAEEHNIVIVGDSKEELEKDGVDALNVLCEVVGEDPSQNEIEFKYI